MYIDLSSVGDSAASVILSQVFGDHLAKMLEFFPILIESFLFLSSACITWHKYATHFSELH